MTTEPTDPVPMRAPITLDHIALQAELLAVELRQIRLGPHIAQAEIDHLHCLVAHCLLLLKESS